MNKSSDSTFFDRDYIDKLSSHYAPLVASCGDSFRAVDWGSSSSQYKRFDILLNSTDWHNKRILDVGCGVGHLAGHLDKQGFKGSYLGVDMVPEMVEKCRLYHENYNFKAITSLEEASFFEPELVVASGLFTFADDKRFRETISQLFALTRHVLAFNSLSIWSESQASGEFHASPVSTLEYCSTLSRHIVLRHDYMPHDFTVYLYKQKT